MERDVLDLQGPFSVPELDIDVRFGHKDPLRKPGYITVYDLLSLGQRCGLSEIKTLSVLARQLYIYDCGGLYYQYDHKRDWKSVISVARKREAIPFVVGQTAAAILQFGVSENIDPTLFLRKRVGYVPTESELSERGFGLCDVEKAMDKPARIVGSAVAIHWDGIDENMVLLGKRVEGAYIGKITIPGGYGEGPIDPFSLAEMMEETGLERHVLKTAEPLGTADQIIFMSNKYGGVDLARYVNLVWEVDVSFNPNVYEAERFGWRMYCDDVVPEDQLTPIAKIALKMAGFM